MTAEYVKSHAAVRPDALAIIDNGRQITYGEFARDIRKCIGALGEFGLTPGASVAINCGDFYVEWLLRLACEELSLTTARFQTPEISRALSSLQRFDLVLSSHPIDSRDVRRYHAATSEWIQGILNRPDPGETALPLKAADDVVSIIYTSGTTGTPKRLMLTRGVFERRVEKLLWFVRLTPASRYLLAVQSTGRTHAACISAGATVVIEARMTVPEAIAAHGVTHLTLPPNGLKRALDDLPKDFEKPRQLAILSFGAPLPGALREEAQEKLATEVWDLYGSNEVGFVSSCKGAAEFGSLWPGVEIEIVNDCDQPVPHGETGWIKIKTDCMVHGYIDDRETSERLFRGGWFHTQDLGRFRGDRQLQIIGRGDDVLNIGWLKLAPSMLEDLVLKFVPTGDVGVCAVATPDGIERICVVLSNPRCADHEILKGIKEAFGGLQIGKFSVLKTDRIPRNANGKIQRAELKDFATRMAQPR